VRYDWRRDDVSYITRKQLRKASKERKTRKPERPPSPEKQAELMNAPLSRPASAMSSRENLSGEKRKSKDVQKIVTSPKEIAKLSETELVKPEPSYPTQNQIMSRKTSANPPPEQLNPRDYGW
jgi:hypothetical protein